MRVVVMGPRKTESALHLPLMRVESQDGYTGYATHAPPIMTHPHYWTPEMTKDEIKPTRFCELQKEYADYCSAVQNDNVINQLKTKNVIDEGAEGAEATVASAGLDHALVSQMKQPVQDKIGVSWESLSDTVRVLNVCEPDAGPGGLPEEGSLIPRPSKMDCRSNAMIGGVTYLCN